MHAATYRQVNEYGDVLLSCSCGAEMSAGPNYLRNHPHALSAHLTWHETGQDITVDGSAPWGEDVEDRDAGSGSLALLVSVPGLVAALVFVVKLAAVASVALS